MTQDLFDREEAAKKRGMAKAANANEEMLGWARFMAVELCRGGHTTTVDAVRDRICNHPRFSPGNWMGTIFNDHRFVATGEFVRSTHKGGHRRMVRVWKLKDGAA